MALRVKYSAIKLAFHDADTNTDADLVARILARKCRMLGCIDVSGMSVSAPWNASLSGLR